MITPYHPMQTSPFSFVPAKLGFLSLGTVNQFISVTQSCLSLCDPMDCSMPGFPNHHQLLELAQTHVHLVIDAIQPFHPLLSPSPPAFSLSQHQGLFQWVSSLHQVAKIFEPQLQHQSFQWKFRTDFLYDWLVWFPAVQGTLTCLLQHYILKASILCLSAFFMVQLSHPYMTTGKTIDLTRLTFVSKNFVSKVISLLFNMLSRLVIAFLPRGKCLNFMAAVTICSDVGAQENKVSHCFHCFPIYLPWSDGTRCHDLSFLNVEF